ncbi:MAG: hydrolase [Rhodobacterales bacterium]|nr:MAG: hydrolase [Rhodobacterales bacterium]
MKIALWQTTPHHDTQEALDALEQAVLQAHGEGADLLLAPEMVLGGYNVGGERCATLAASAEALIAALKTIAQKHRMALVVGLALPGAARPYNAAIAIDGAGAEQQRYHKTHLYGEVDRAQFTAGSALSRVFEVTGWRIGLAICYDIEFPEVARSLALQGADLILVPTANMIPFDSVATRLVPARAEENAVYVAYANYTGQEGVFTYGGLSCICGPDGHDLARASQDAAQLLFAELSHSHLAQCRVSQTHLSDRRPDLYAPLHEKGLSHD